MRKMVDMKRSAEEKVEAMTPPTPADTPDYPYGLCISLCEDDLERLDLDSTDCEIGDTIHIFAFAEVTSVTKTQKDGKSHERIELQITHLGLEDEDKETASEASEEEE